MILAQVQDAAAEFDWAREFRPFTAFHVLTSGACLAAIGVSSFYGARCRGSVRERRLRLAWVVAVLVVQVLALVYFMRDFDIRVGLPFHICDIAGWVAALALLTQRRTLRVILYYWGIVLSTQAFATPILRGEGSGYAGPYYWAFWLQHLTIVGSAVYDIIVLRFRPTWRDWGLAVVLSSSWVGAMFVFNRVFGTNYVFVGPSRPDNPTLIDSLGPYPWRVLWLSMIVTAGFALATALWPSAWRRPGASDAERSSA